MKLIYRGRKIKVPARKVSFFGKVSGLMFRKRDTDNLIFENAKGLSLHSFFVFFVFLVLWVDDADNVLDFRIIKPFSLGVKSRKSFSKIVEIPLNKRNSKIIDFFVGEEKFK